MGKESFINNDVYQSDIQELSLEKKITLGYFNGSEKVLEIGANRGYFTKLMIEKGCRVTCIEIDPLSANHIRQFSSNLIIGDIEDDDVMSLLVDTYDVILLMHVLEHMIDPWNVLRKLKSKLSKDGFILVLIPSISFWGFRRKFLLTGDFTYTDTGIFDKTHLRFFNYHTAKKLLTGSGYEIVEEKIPNCSIPLSVRIRKIPLLRRLEKYWNKWMIKKYPNLVGEIFLFQVKPVHDYK